MTKKITLAEITCFTPESSPELLDLARRIKDVSPSVASTMIDALLDVTQEIVFEEGRVCVGSKYLDVFIRKLGQVARDCSSEEVRTELAREILTAKRQVKKDQPKIESLETELIKRSEIATIIKNVNFGSIAKETCENIKAEILAEQKAEEVMAKQAKAEAMQVKAEERAREELAKTPPGEGEVKSFVEKFMSGSAQKLRPKRASQPSYGGGSDFESHYRRNMGDTRLAQAREDYEPSCETDPPAWQPQGRSLSECTDMTS